METSRSRSGGELREDAAAQAGLLCVPANVTSMTEADYETLGSALATAAGLLASRRVELNAADLRIRSLVSLAEKEAKRALMEARNNRHRPVNAQSQPSAIT